VTYGSHGQYVSSVGVIGGGGANDGYVDVTGSLPTPVSTGHEVLALIDLEGLSDVDAFLDGLEPMSGSPTFVIERPGDPIFDELAGQYGGDWEAVIRFTDLPPGTTSGALKLNWKFDATDGALLERVVIVPEPTLAVALGSLGLLALRRRSA
jgi:hypothetical protein